MSRVPDRDIRLGDIVTGKAVWEGGVGYMLVTGRVISNVGINVIVTDYVIHYAESEVGIKILNGSPNLVLDEFFRTEDVKHATAKNKRVIS